MLFKTVWFLYPTVHMRDIIQVYCFSMGLTLLLLTVPSRDGEIIKGCFMVKTYYNTAEPIVADNPYRVSPFFCERFSERIFDISFSSYMELFTLSFF